MNYFLISLRNFPEVLMWHSESEISLGSRVEVKLRGKKKIGIVVGETQEKPSFKTQPVIKVLNKIFIQESYFKIAKEVAEENFCRLGKVLDLMIPEKYFEEEFPEKREVFYELKNSSPDSINIQDLESGLASKEIEFFKAHKIRGEKQKEALKIFLENGGKVSADILRKSISLLTLNNLEKKGLIKKIEGNIKLIDTDEIFKSTQVYDLKSWQKKALIDIENSDKPVLLWGITGSGKTEVYKHLVLNLDKKLKAKNQKFQVLLLVPEIALTPQLINEFKSVFGKKIAVWHSKLNAQEKVQEYERVRIGEAQILIGARSSVFVPMPNLKLVILDEEHEWTFKNEFNPRFRTHDVVEKIRQKMGVKLLFGSATPRVESLVKVQKGAWNKVELFKKVFEQKLPQIEIIDIKNESKKGNYSPISEKLFIEIKRKIKDKRQIVLFLNKRGFSGSTFCAYCSQKFECKDCSANMKVHGFARKNVQAKLLCHLCGHMENFPTSCPGCGKKNFQFRGWGTEQVESFLKKYLPKSRVLRVDRDSVKGKHDLQNILKKFYHHEADILLGTQMVAKGLDFEKVDLVGIIMADVGLSLPDFRSEERVFQLLHQVSGRAGRRKTQGRVLIQTYNPEEPLFLDLKNNLVQEFYSKQIKDREENFLPPFSHMVKITISAEKKSDSFTKAFRIYKDLKKIMDREKLNFEISWAPAFFPKMHNKFWFHVFLKTPKKSMSFAFLKHFHLEEQEGVVIDMSPNSLL